MSKTISRRKMLEIIGTGALITTGGLLTDCKPEKPEPECYSDQLPELTITNETEQGKNDGIITNSNNYPVDVSTTRNFSSDKFTLQPGESLKFRPPGKYFGCWSATRTCPADINRVKEITIEKGMIPTPPCHPEQLPNPTITHETTPGANDGKITNSSNYPMQISQTRDFLPENTFILPPGETQEDLSARNYFIRWGPNGTCPADINRVKEIIINKGVTPPLDIDKIEPYTEGSCKEWALSSLKQLDNSEEKIRLYNYLLRAHTYLMLHDKNNYIAEYNAGKENLLYIISIYGDENANWQGKLDYENWIIHCKYPLEKPFRLTYEEINKVSEYLREANPQFFLGTIPLNFDNIAGGISVALSMPAYYAFADRRQQTYKKILDGFDSFKSKLEKAVNINNRHDVVKYVYDDVIKTLDPDRQTYDYISRETLENHDTILGYFGDSKHTKCGGYSHIIAYLLNRLGIPTITQTGSIEGSPHAWNIIQMEDGQWYFMDSTWDDYGQDTAYNYFLKGEGTGGKLPGEFLYNREITDDILYPECSIEDYPIPVWSMQSPVRAAAGVLSR